MRFSKRANGSGVVGPKRARLPQAWGQRITARKRARTRIHRHTGPSDINTLSTTLAERNKGGAIDCQPTTASVHAES